jgi:hypothetical protein
LVRARFTFRQCSNKNYTTTVPIDETGMCDEPINAWFYTLATGSSVLKCCAHITALIWHLDVCPARIRYVEHVVSASCFILTIQDCLRYPDIEDSIDVADGSRDTDSDHNRKLYIPIPLIVVRFFETSFNRFLSHAIHRNLFLTRKGNVNYHTVLDSLSLIFLKRMLMFIE